MIFTNKKNGGDFEIDPENLPKHIGIILDGNGRWAKKRGLPRSAGHSVGVDNMKTVIRECNRIGIESVTSYVFSTENWKRPKDEVDFLMKLFIKFFDNYKKELEGENIVMRVIGARENLDPHLVEKIAETEEYTKNNTGTIVNMALNYGSREEITRAVKGISQDVKNGIIKSEDITPQMITDRLYTAGQHEVDLLIRTSGEMRISNFLMWQISYAELWFSEKMWPEFTNEDLHMAIYDYGQRKRRFGGI
ncbi:MAG: isoprenyl transferase [Oscillospiraceae bacterium]|nr:isoprenyl transferase [Oscillospiraceae bacterium]